MGPGDKVSLKYDGEELTGILMPSAEEDKKNIILKLPNGYTVGLAKSKIKDEKILETYSKKAHAEGVLKTKKGLPIVSILS
ncbi:MAG: Glu-tRNA(Gln) amidotransferase GatDE subunit D, partial [Nanoarchaeota archaeon]|nr:Glu-tRNA(Gln) amidotransferase GatDE subunit D [Nanoarchaeota archaeon]